MKILTTLLAITLLALSAAPGYACNAFQPALCNAPRASFIESLAVVLVLLSIPVLVFVTAILGWCWDAIRTRLSRRTKQDEPA